MGDARGDPRCITSQFGERHPVQLPRERCQPCDQVRSVRRQSDDGLFALHTDYRKTPSLVICRS